MDEIKKRFADLYELSGNEKKAFESILDNAQAMQLNYEQMKKVLFTAEKALFQVVTKRPL